MVCKLMDIMPPDVWVIPLICGAGSTVIWNVRVALKFGVPPSVTRTVAVLVLPACAADGVQLNRPKEVPLFFRLKLTCSAGSLGVLRFDCPSAHTSKKPCGGIT